MDLGRDGFRMKTVRVDGLPGDTNGPFGKKDTTVTREVREAVRQAKPE
jgi:hypothetical protein